MELEYTELLVDLEYTELVLTAELLLWGDASLMYSNFVLPPRTTISTYLKYLGQAKFLSMPCWHHFFDRLWQAIRLLKKITLILMTPGWCRDEMPTRHHFRNSFLCPLGISFEKGQTGLKRRQYAFFLCQALPGFDTGFDTGNTPNCLIMTFLWPF